ncbi:MAG TPA: GntR family transcriptional regulator [Chthoniobacteraceae bacterium]|nr:GntR family transcriptional regulator [Chthoniobacteraceae bacterium]
MLASSFPSMADHPLPDFYTGLEQMLQKPSQLPLYRQVASVLSGSIRAGRLGAGEKLLSERQLAQQLGISRKTVRAAFLELVEARLIAPAHGLGYHVCETVEPRRFRYLVPESFEPNPHGKRSPYFDWFHKAGGEAEASLHYVYAPDTAAFRDLLETPPPGYDGILVFRPSQPWLDVLFDLPEGVLRRLPILVVNRDRVPAGVHFVSADHFGQTRLATGHLLSLGHRRVGYIGGFFEIGYLHRTWEGYEAALREAGLVPLEEDRLLLDHTRPEAMKEEIAAFLDRRGFSGVVIGGGAFLQPFEEVYLSRGMVIPRELSVVASTEKGMLEALTVRWSACLFPTVEVARQSLEVLMEISRGQWETPAAVLVPPEFTPGATAIRHASS